VDYLEFGKNFIKARNRKGVDQKTAAGHLSVSPAFLSKVENNKQKPSLELILNAADYYGVEPGFFFDTKKEINIDNLYKKNEGFINDMGLLTDEELREKYKIQLDGKELSEKELKGIMAYVRSLRAIED
jgi:transcriptional regulator with XRE-family HTH domain